MKCFKCGSRCVTDYIKRDYDTDVIIAVQKVCTVCDWRSHPVKIPDPIAVDVQACTSKAINRNKVE